MESLSLSSVSTIVKMAQDIATAVETVNRNKSRCKKLQKRVQGISDVLGEAGTASAATQRLLDRLQDTLARGLRLVNLCKRRRCPISLIAGGRMAEQFDEVDGEIDRCLLDLGAANHVIVARLEKQLVHLNMAGATETVTLRIGMPCDDSAEKIKHCIGTMQGVTEVAELAGAVNKDQFMVTVRSGAVDIPSLMDQVKQKLNRNVELITPAATAKDAAGADVKKNVVKDEDEKVSRKGEGVEDRSDRQQRHSSRYAAGVETKEEKAAANMVVGVNQQAPAHARPQSNLHPVHFKDASVNNNYDSGCYTKGTMMTGSSGMDEKKGAVAGDCIVDKKGKVAGDGEWKDRDYTAAAGNDTAIGVPLYRHHGMPEMVPPPSYGHGYWAYATADCRSTGGPSDAFAAHRYNHNSSYPGWFSDENPNACSIM